MRVCIVPDPSLCAIGGLQVQVRETIRALDRLHERGGAVEVKLAHPRKVSLDGCDVLHVFGAAADNDRLLAAAAAMDVPLLLSARVSASWSRSNGTRARVADRVQGNRTDWDLDTSYARIRRALRQASLVVAVDEAERRAICDAFLIAPNKVRVIANAVGPQFFDADPALFRERSRIAGQFALMVGDVSPYHNQLGIARLLAGLALPLVVIGDARERDALYLRELRTVRTVTCLGAVDHDDAMLASAFAAASVFLVHGHEPGLPMAALEALAAGTPVVASGAMRAQLPGGEFALVQVGAQGEGALECAVAALLESPPKAARVRALVAACTWDAVAARLADCYRQLAALRR